MLLHKINIDLIFFLTIQCIWPRIQKIIGFSRFFNSIRNNKPITIFKKANKQEHLHVTDAITAMFLVNIKGKEFVYNIGNDKPE